MIKTLSDSPVSMSLSLYHWKLKSVNVFVVKPSVSRVVSPAQGVVCFGSATVLKWPWINFAKNASCTANEFGPTQIFSVVVLNAPSVAIPLTKIVLPLIKIFWLLSMAIEP